MIPLTILNAVEGKVLPVYGRGQNIRDWLYVEDHVKALDLITDKGQIGRTYNVGGRNERRNIDVVRTICALVDKHVPSSVPRSTLIEFVPDRPGHDARYAIDATRIETELSWRAEETFETGIKKTILWYLENRWWWEPLITRYQRQRLGLQKAGSQF